MSYFTNFNFFYRYLRYKIFIAVGISILISALDAFGISMFLPLIQSFDKVEGINAKDMGGLRFLVDGMQTLGIDLTIGSVLLLILLFFILKAIVSYFGMVYGLNLQQSFIKNIRLDLLEGLNTLSYKAFVTTDAGRIQNTISGEVERVAKAYNTYFRAFQQGVMVFVYTSFAFFVDAQFAILVCLGGILINSLHRLVYKYTKRASRKLTFSTNLYQGEVIQYISGFKYLKATGRVRQYGERLKATIHNIESSRLRIGKLESIGLAVREPVLIAVIASVILLYTKMFAAELGPILISLLFFYRALMALLSMQQSWGSFVSVSGSLENMQDFQARLEANKEQNGRKEFKKLETTIKLKDVDFSYQDSPILKGINLEISRKESVAFVGESGSGKTTMVNIIAGLLLPDRGEVKINNRSIQQFDKESYQQRIGYIPQEPVVFNDTIFNNITFWDTPSEKTKKRFEKAIKQASIYEFIGTLPEAEETLLGNNGINLSGGQKQRIAIARELYKNIDILILDEATSALDSETERVIQESIESLKGQYTILTIAHRLSTIRNASRIVYMHKGEIEDVGSFDDLINRQERFKNMVALQELSVV